jgi:uncharacterized protein (TIGR02646 family)
MIKLTRKPCPNTEKLKKDYKYKENKEALRDSSFGKCMYCESEISHIDYGDVEHIKPKSLFPAEKFSWDNLGYACPKCNREFKNENYDPDIINPYDIEPTDYLYFIGCILRAKGGNNKGRITIEIIQLNRPELLAKRREVLLLFNELILRFQTAISIVEKNALKKLIETYISDTIEYSACLKTFWQETK